MISTDPKTLPISVIIPTLNEEENIARTIESASNPLVKEIIAVDGGSSDLTRTIARSAGVVCIKSTPGRAFQLNTGAKAAKGEILLFLHADTILPPSFITTVNTLINTPGTAAGAFLLTINIKNSSSVRMLEKGISWRSRYLEMPYGDQALFVKRDVFFKVNGFDNVPILEDLYFIRKIRKLGKITIANSAVTTSGRRWQELGLIKTTLINQGILIGALLGISPQRLQNWYRVCKK